MANTPAELHVRQERRDVQRNLARVLQAASELFGERGLEAVRMEEVAQRAGVGVGTIYRRFRSKEDLFAAVSQAACSDTRDTLQAAAHSATSPVGKLRALVIVQYQRSAAQAELLNMRQSPGAGGCGVFDQQQLYATLHTMLEEVIAEGQRAGVLRAGHPSILAALCLELLHPRASQHLTQSIGVRPEDLAEHTADFVIHALQNYGER